MGIESTDFNVLIGSETGLLKAISVNVKGNIAKNFNGSNLRSLSKDDEITAMTFGCNEQELLLGTRSQIVRAFDVEEKRFIRSFDASTTWDVKEENHGPLRGIGRLTDETLVTAVESGLIRVWRAETTDRFSVNTIDHEVTSSRKFKQRKFEKAEDRDKHVTSLKAGRTLHKMKTVGGRFIASGGKENDLQIWDAETSKLVFMAKNVRPDKLQLRVPVWVTDIGFLGSTNDVVVTTNRYGHIRMYDRRINDQRRPVQERMFLEKPDDPDSPLALTTLCVVNGSTDRLLVGTATGQVGLFDFRSAFKNNNGLVRKYKGSVGSVRSLHMGQNSSYFGCVGLDRFLRIYDVNERKVTAKLYLKSRLNHILLRSDFDPTKLCMSQPEDKNESSCVDGLEVIKVEKDEEMNSEGDSDIEIIEEESENESRQQDSDESKEDNIQTKRRKI